MKVIGLAFLVVAIHTYVLLEVDGHCNLCQSTNTVACHNETTYSLCVDGHPTFEYIVCPPSFVCTNDRRVCSPKETAIASCAPEPEDLRGNRCGVCGSVGKVFSCLNETTIAFCFGLDSPHLESLAECPVNTVCDLNNKNFCTASEETVASCQTSRMSGCAWAFANGKQYILNPIDPTCQRYIHCLSPEQEILKRCDNSMYFNEDLQLCQSERPDGCIVNDDTTLVTSSTDNPSSTETISSGATETTEKNSARCADAIASGRRSFRNDSDPTCATFTICIHQVDTILEVPYRCEKNTFFDENLEFCTNDRPEECSSSSSTETSMNTGSTADGGTSALTNTSPIPDITTTPTSTEGTTTTHSVTTSISTGSVSSETTVLSTDTTTAQTVKSTTVSTETSMSTGSTADGGTSALTNTSPTPDITTTPTSTEGTTTTHSVMTSISTGSVSSETTVLSTDTTTAQAVKSTTDNNTPIVTASSTVSDHTSDFTTDITPTRTADSSLESSTSTTMISISTADTTQKSITNCEEALAVGKTSFKNNSDATCTTYTNCIKMGEFIREMPTSCPKNLYYNSDLGLCHNDKPKGCLSVPETTTTAEPNPEGDEAYVISACKKAGALAMVKDITDPTCKSYMYCWVSNDEFKPLKKSCSKAKPYFHEESATCEADKPQGCT